MGTQFSISIVTTSKGKADNLANIAEEQIHENEARFSRFQLGSELSLLNTKKSAVVSNDFFTVAEEAYRLFVRTQGIFNPLVQIEKFGYNKTFDELSSYTTDTHTEEPYDIDFATTIIDPTTRTITLKEGHKLDFGGFLKGYLATKICKEIMSSSPEVTGAIVNIGGDLHTEGFDEHNTEFTFEIYNPVTQKDDIVVSVHNKSLATSGTYKRTWVHNRTQVHHILDVTGMQNPDTDIVSVSIVNDDGATAEAYTKVFLNVGIKEALEILKNEKILYLCIDTKGVVTTNI